MNARGTHILVDLYGIRDPGTGCAGILFEIAKIADCKVVSTQEHVFKGEGGRTTLLLLSTSHASIHTWPEHRYASFDLYSCKELPQVIVDRVVEYIKKVTFSEREQVQVVKRGYAV